MIKPKKAKQIIEEDMIKKETSFSMGTAYDLNKQLVEQNCNPLTEGEIRAGIDLLGKFIFETKNKYYMLLCHDRRDYTIIHGFSRENTCIDMAYTVRECLENRGILKSIEETQDKQAYEIWLSINNESYCYYFFPYDAAIVEV